MGAAAAVIRQANCRFAAQAIVLSDGGSRFPGKG